MAERRYSSDGEAGRLAHGVRVRPLEPEPRRVDLAIARAEAHHELVPAPEHERLDDLTHVAADGSGGVRRSPRRVRELAHLHVEPALAQPLLHLESRRVDPIRVVAVDGVTVRESRPGDGEQIARIHRESGRLYRELAPDLFREPDADGLAEFCEPEPPRDDLLQLVAEIDGAITGFLEAQLVPPLEGARYQRNPDLGLTRLSIGAVETDEAYRRRGVATALVSTAEEWGRSQGASVALCDTWVGSPLSVPFWEERMRYHRRAIIFRKPL